MDGREKQMEKWKLPYTDGNQYSIAQKKARQVRQAKYDD